MSERRNCDCGNTFIWNQFLANLDIKVVKSGLAYDVCSWEGLHGFSGDFFYRLYLPLTGKFKILYPGGECLLEPGNLYLIPCTTPFKNEGVEPCTHYWIHFVSNQLQTLFMLNYPSGVFLEDPETVQRNISALYERMKICSTFSDAVLIKNTVTELLVPFLEKMSEHLPETGSVSEFSKIVNYIDLQLKRDIEVSELSSIVGMRRANFSAAFRKVFGVPPKQYISIRRLFHAKQLLLETSLPIKEISVRCGYKDEFFFHRIFRKYIGIPPAKYRKYSVY